MKDIIHTKLQEIESTRSVRILMAVESGSRAWGFASPNSDFDVRFIYAHPEDWYFSITEKRDVIELPVNDVLDINGWDIRKALRLLNKSNPVLMEWMQSPLMYMQNDAFLLGFSQLAADQFSPIAAAFHYLSMAKNKYLECTQDETVKLKSYLYSVRATLALKWIVNKRSVPPMELEHLFVELESESLLTRVRQLVQIKASQEESYRHAHEIEIENWLGQTISSCEVVMQQLPGSKGNVELLNELFRKSVRQQ